MRPYDLAPRVIAEQRHGQFLWDVIAARTGNMVEVLTPAGVFQDLRPFFLRPDATDDEAWHGGFEMYAQNVSAQPLTLVHGLDRSRTVWVNRDLLAETEVAGVDDLLKPQLRGRILIDAPSSLGGGSVGLTAILQVKGEAFLRQLMVDQQPMYLEDPAMVTSWVVEGRYPVGIGVDTNRLVQFKAAGVGRHVEELAGASSGVLMASGASVFRNAPHPNATRVFLNWFWSREGQTAWSQNVELNSRRRDVHAFDPEAFPDYNHLGRYALLGTQQSSALFNHVLSFYQSIR
jgi:iron(III) transport system substrate-binding protein